MDGSRRVKRKKRNLNKLNFFHRVKEAELLKPGISVMFLHDDFIDQDITAFIAIYFVFSNNHRIQIYFKRTFKWILTEISFLLFKGWKKGVFPEVPIVVERKITRKGCFKTIYN